MPEFIDTHSHLYVSQFKPDLSDVVERAKRSGITNIILPAIDMAHHEQMADIERSLPGFTHSAIGLHPTSVKENWKEELDFVLENAEREEYIAIGEVGIDRYWSVEYINEQRAVFEEQLRLSSTKSLPVIIHSREATEEIFNTLNKVRSLSLYGIFHAYSGSLETFERIRTYGDFLIGIGGVITYKNSSLVKIIEKVPLNMIVLETDSPWLTPVPYRGKRNEPSYITLIAQKIAEIKGCSIEEVAVQTSLNARRIFNLNAN